MDRRLLINLVVGGLALPLLALFVATAIYLF